MNISRTLRVTLATTLLGGGVVALTPTVAQAAEVTATLVATRPTGTNWSRSVPDPSGITYDPGRNQLVLSDGEVDEMPALYEGANIFRSTLTGQEVSTMAWTTLPWSNEPAGISYNSATRYIVSDDDKDRIYLVNVGSDGKWVAGTDPGPTSFTTRTLNADPEDVTVDTDFTKDGHIVVVDGVTAMVFDYSAGPNGRFEGFKSDSDDVIRQFDVGKYGAGDPEGIEYHPDRNTLLVLDQSSRKVYELDRQGVLLNVIGISAANPVKAAGMTLAPASDGSGTQNLYIVDRGVDNQASPGENDGRFHEMSVTFPPLDGGGDIVAPTVTHKTPPAGKTGVGRLSNVTATFSEAVQDVNGTTFTLRNDSNNSLVTAVVKLSSTTNKWILNPSSTLPARTRFTATVVGGADGVKDIAGNPLTTTVTWSFTTGA
jgi:uncharacterized protein YjiK